MFACVRAFGQTGGNPVLAILQGVRDFELRRKYPQPAKAFAGGGWRVYYHSHPLAGPSSREHGHFHLFAPSSVEEAQWAHLAALAMDREGQPLRWFATNRWVTGGAWCERGPLLAAIDALVPEAEPDTLGCWLTAMLQLYREDLAGLLRARDARLAQQATAHPQQDALADRRLYELAQAPIDLGTKLTERLRGGVT